MYFIISHFTNNLWTTDYLLQYFRKKETPYLFLRHPFQSEKELQYSELLYFDGKEEKILRRYTKYNNFFLEMIRNYFLTFYCSLRHLFFYKKIIWFWSFNTVPFLWARLFWKETYFWWVDYSRKRFWNKLLNVIYLFFETVWCGFAKKVIHLSKRQEAARIKYHFLSLNKSIIISNWFEDVSFKKNYFHYDNFAFFFLWNISRQHWILDFIEFFYVKHKIDHTLYIIWWWEFQEQLLHIIEKHDLSDKVVFVWRKNKEEIKNFLLSLDEKIIGIAPYSDEVNDHVYYWDSLKIREYLGYNIPFLVSDVAYIADDLKKFGIIYTNFEEIDLDSLRNFHFNIQEKNQVLEKYTWDNIFNKVF